MLHDPKLSNIFCVLDGLDEYDEDSRLDLVRHLFVVTSDNTTCRFKLMGFSRPILGPDFNPQCNISMDLDQLHSTAEDVHRFVEHSLKRLSRIRGFDKIRNEVHETLVIGAGGTFLWIGLLMETVGEKAHSIGDTVS